MTRQQREELNQMSKEVFGTSSKWQKLINHGVAEPFERNREVMVPRSNGELIKKVFTDKKSVAKYYTVEEVKKLMLEILEAKKEKKEISVAENDSVNLNLSAKFESGMVIEGNGVPEDAVVK